MSESMDEGYKTLLLKRRIYMSHMYNLCCASAWRKGNNSKKKTMKKNMSHMNLGLM